MTESLCKCGTISIIGMMSADQTDTKLSILLRTQSLTHSQQKPISQQNYKQMDRDKQE